MKKATQEDYEVEMAAFNDAWRLLKKYYFIGPDMEEWFMLVSEAGEICIKHKTEFIKQLVHLVIDHLGKLQKEREGGKTHGSGSHI